MYVLLWTYQFEKLRNFKNLFPILKPFYISHYFNLDDI